MNDVSARRRCCAEVQAPGARGGGGPPGKIGDFPATSRHVGAGALVSKIAVSWENALDIAAWG